MKIQKVYKSYQRIIRMLAGLNMKSGTEFDINFNTREPEKLMVSQKMGTDKEIQKKQLKGRTLT